MQQIQRFRNRCATYASNAKQRVEIKRNKRAVVVSRAHTQQQRRRRSRVRETSKMNSLCCDDANSIFFASSLFISSFLPIGVKFNSRFHVKSHLVVGRTKRKKKHSQNQFVLIRTISGKKIFFTIFSADFFHFSRVYGQESKSIENYSVHDLPG